MGRGPLFGPVVAAAVVLPEAAFEPLQKLGVTDSKKLSDRRRLQLLPEIRRLALDCRIGVATVTEIDRLNILQATFLAMRRAVAKLEQPPQLALVDGNRRVPGLTLDQRTLIGGDARCLTIACASIVAKVWRDQLIERLAQRYPGYGLERHKGYGTAEHRQAIATLGLTPQHRRSFAPCREQQLTLL